MIHDISSISNADVKISQRQQPDITWHYMAIVIPGYEEAVFIFRPCVLCFLGLLKLRWFQDKGGGDSAFPCFSLLFTGKKAEVFCSTPTANLDPSAQSLVTQINYLVISLSI